MIYLGYTEIKEKEYIMTATISSWGNSQGLRFPKDIMKELHLSIGDKVKILIENQKIIIEPIKVSREKYDKFDNKTGLEEW